MIKVTVSNNLDRFTDTFTPDTTLRECFEKFDIDHSMGMITLKSTPVPHDDIDKTLADFGLDGTAGNDRAFLGVVAKAANA